MKTIDKPYNDKLIFESDSMSVHEASIQFNHKAADRCSHICMVDGIDLFLFGCVTIQTPSGNTAQGDFVMALIHLDVNASKQELFSFLQGNKAPKFDGYEITSKPWFEWQNRDGKTIGKPFDEIPSDITELKVPE